MASMRAVFGLLLTIMVIQSAMARELHEGGLTSSGLRTLLAPITVSVGDVKIRSCKNPTPCPKDGKFFYCHDKDEKAFRGCRPVSQNPFPSADCSASSQCIANNK